MKKILIFSLILLMASFATKAQEENADTQSQPVRTPFEGGLLIDNQTGVIPTAKTLEMIIQHRFGTTENGLTDLYGIYAPGANVRIGFNYSLRDNLMIGFGTTKNKKMQDFQAKYNIFQQTRDNKFPVALTLYGNMAIDCRNETVFGTAYKFSNRFSYFSQLIIGRKINDMFSVQVSPGFTHYNSADTLSDHDKISVSFAGRIKVSPQSSIMLQCDLPLEIKGISEHTTFTDPSKPNFAIAWEISTSTHSFQMYLGTAVGIVPQEIMMNNQNDFFGNQMMIGFTVTRLWSF